MNIWVLWKYLYEFSEGVEVCPVEVLDVVPLDDAGIPHHGRHQHVQLSDEHGDQRVRYDGLRRSLRAAFFALFIDWLIDWLIDGLIDWLVG